MQIDMPKYSSWVQKFFHKGAPRGEALPNVNFGPA